MQDTEIIKIIFGIFLSAFSITLYIIAFTLFYKYLVQEKKCTSKVIGILKNPMEKLYPVGSEIEVYYSLENPKLSYAIRYCNKKSAFYITSITATLILIMDILMVIML